jgi:hypothetical protein
MEDYTVYTSTAPIRHCYSDRESTIESTVNFRLDPLFCDIGPLPALRLGK